MPRKSRKNVGLIGLGIIGTRVALNLRSAGFQVFVWNRTPKPAPNFLGSPAEVASLCDVIQLFVADAAALMSVIEAFGDSLTADHVIVCNATVGPEATLEAARIVEAKGARFLDAPFTGSRGAAEKAQLVYYVGGSETAFKKAEPFLKAASKAIVPCGAVGHAAVLKVATNMISAVTAQTLAEALALVGKSGLDPAVFATALENNACRSGVTDLKLPKMIARDYEPHFSLKHMAKDLRIARQMAEALDLEMPVTTRTSAVMESGLGEGWGDLDFAAVAKVYQSVPEAAWEEVAALPSADDKTPPPAIVLTLEGPVEPPAVKAEAVSEIPLPAILPAVPAEPSPLAQAPVTPMPVPESLPVKVDLVEAKTEPAPASAVAELVVEVIPLAPLAAAEAKAPEPASPIEIAPGAKTPETVVVEKAPAPTRAERKRAAKAKAAAERAAARKASAEKASPEGAVTAKADALKPAPGDALVGAGSAEKVAAEKSAAAPLAAAAPLGEKLATATVVGEKPDGAPDDPSAEAPKKPFNRIRRFFFPAGGR